MQGRGRPRRLDRERGEAWKTTAPDTDKLVRTIGDALTAANLIADLLYGYFDPRVRT